MYKTLFTLFIFVTAIVESVAQPAQTKNYPKGYFRNPVGIPLEIVANMGELRPNHWHMGLDIRTDQKENLPVYASAEGYIAHIGIRPQSFGRFIVINHPNGLSTLYAHLNDFFPELEQYVTDQQYKKETWAIELDFSSRQFPVSKGQFIAYSGNTGGSQGPHVHFEIFDTKTTKRLNPLLFNFPLRDEVPPTLVKLAIYDRGKSVYDQTPQFLAVKNTDSGYIIPKMPLIRTGLTKISFGIQAYDRISGSTNADGVYSARLIVDELPQVEFVIDSIDYDETGYMNAQVDYKYRNNGGPFVQHLSRMPGDFGGVYHPIRSDGVIDLNDTSVHAVTIDVRDAYNNISKLNFLIQHDPGLYKQGIALNTQKLVPAEVNVVEKPGFEVYLPEGCLYDTVTTVYYRNNNLSAYAVSGIHQLNDVSVPVHGELTVRIKPDKIVPDEWKDKILIQRSGRGNNVKKAAWQLEWLSASFGDFGNFQAFADVAAPSVNELGRGDTINLSAANRIVFTPRDNFAVKSFRAALNDQWLRFTNDKGRNWIYRFDERCPYGTHKLTVTIEDVVGNTTTKTWWFKRGPYTPPKKAVRKKTTKKKTSSKKKK